MSISKRMDKEAVVHIHQAILLSHLKEFMCNNSNEMDEIGAHYTDLPSFSVTRAGEMQKRQLIHSKYDTHTKQNRCRASKWSSAEMEGDGSAHAST